MPLRIKCPTGHVMIVPDNRVGRELRCPRCDQAFIVPEVAKRPTPRSDPSPQAVLPKSAAEASITGDVASAVRPAGDAPLRTIASVAPPKEIAQPPKAHQADAPAAEPAKKSGVKSKPPRKRTFPPRAGATEARPAEPQSAAPSSVIPTAAAEAAKATPTPEPIAASVARNPEPPPVPRPAAQIVAPTIVAAPIVASPIVAAAPTPLPAVAVEFVLPAALPADAIENLAAAPSTAVSETPSAERPTAAEAPSVKLPTTSVDPKNSAAPLAEATSSPLAKSPAVPISLAPAKPPVIVRPAVAAPPPVPPRTPLTAPQTVALSQPHTPPNALPPPPAPFVAAPNIAAPRASTVYRPAGVQLLASAAMLAAVVSIVPAVADLVDFVRAPHTAFVARWTLVLLMLGVVQFAYGVYLRQLCDWSAVWVITLESLAMAALYAMVVGLTLITAADGVVVSALQLHDQLAGGRATLWCLALCVLFLTLAFFAGRTAVRWRKHEQTLHGVGGLLPRI